MRWLWPAALLLAGCTNWDALAHDAHCQQDPPSCGIYVGRWPDSHTARCSDGTQETACPQPGAPAWGQDGNYTINVPDYQPAAGLMHDTVTGLDWETDSTVSGYTWSGAKTHCQSLGAGWRLPSRLELVSLLDFGNHPPWSGIVDNAHWTSTPGGTADTAWAVDFLNGTARPYPQTDNQFVLCVSGDPLTGVKTTDGDVIHDSLSGLTWERDPPNDRFPWTEALSRCETLSFAGHDDWRLPSAKEALTLGQDDELQAPDLKGDISIDYWTSTPSWPWDKAVAISFPAGHVGSDSTTFAKPARCVRGPD